MNRLKHEVLVMAALAFLGCGTAEPGDEQQRAELSAVQSRTRPQRNDALEGNHSFAHALTDELGRTLFTSTPTGWTPNDLRSAYKLPSSGGSGKIIAIVDPYDNPNAESDLAVYRSQFGLPPCTTANGCFQKVNQNGAASPLPRAADPTTFRALEISIDLDMASAGCPDCNILLIESNTDSNADLYTAVLTAVRMRAAVVSNSWGHPEVSADAATDAMVFNHPGVSIFFSSGDDGFTEPPQYPASSQYVIAVGGTTLRKAGSSRGWSEKAWGGLLTSLGTGSGCSRNIPKPSWETDLLCLKRMVADVAAVAENVAVYDSYSAGSGGWAVGTYGTSIAAPLVAAIYALTGNEAAGPSLPYSKRGAFFDVTSGSTGICLLWPYYCAASIGYDGPTGIGSPNGAVLAGK